MINILRLGQTKVIGNLSRGVLCHVRVRQRLSNNLADNYDRPGVVRPLRPPQTSPSSARIFIIWWLARPRGLSALPANIQMSSRLPLPPRSGREIIMINPDRVGVTLWRQGKPVREERVEWWLKVHNTQH